MEKAARNRKIWFWVMLLTSVTGVAGIPGIVLFAVHGNFLMMALCLFFTVHAFFGVTFYALAMANAGQDVRILAAIETYGALTVADLSAATSIPVGSVSASVNRSLRRGYLFGYTFDGTRLFRILPAERKCPFCGSMISTAEAECPACGAPQE